MESFTGKRNKSEWQYTMMIMVPAWISPEMFDSAKLTAGAKHPELALDRVRLEVLNENFCVQTLHAGSYDDEDPDLKEMHDPFIPESNLRMTGKHHEIYPGDPRRTAPEKLKTILRQPVSRI